MTRGDDLATHYDSGQRAIHPSHADRHVRRLHDVLVAEQPVDPRHTHIVQPCHLIIGEFCIESCHDSSS